MNLTLAQLFKREIVKIRYHRYSSMGRTTLSGSAFQEMDWGNPVVCLIFISGILIALVTISFVVDSQRHGNPRYYKKLTLMLFISFFALISCILFSFINSAPVWLDFLGGCLTFLLLGYGVFLQFEFLASVLILADIHVHNLVPRFQIVWSIICLILTLPVYFLVPTLGKEPFPWIYKEWVLGKMIFGGLCALYDICQGVVSLILLIWHLERKSKFTKQGDSFLNSQKECQKLFSLTLLTFLCNLSALCFDIAVMFGPPIDTLLPRVVEQETVAIIAVLYYLQMIKVAKIVLRPKQKKAPRQVEPRSKGSQSKETRHMSILDTTMITNALE